MHKERGWMLSFKVCRESLRKWSGDARILSVMLLTFLFEWILIEPIRGSCDMYELSMSNWFFVFLFKGIQAMFYFFGVLLLFCDAPFVDSQQMDVILRVGKRNWFRGKILYIISASVLYFLYLCFVSIAGYFPNVRFSTEWGELVNTLSAQHHSVVRRGIVASYTPLEAFIVQFMVCVLFAVFLGLLIFYLNLGRNKNLGPGVALTLVLMGAVVNISSLKGERFWVYFTPMVWTDIEVYKKDAGGVSLAYAVSMFCIGIAVLVVLIMRKSKSYNIECQEEM